MTVLTQRVSVIADGSDGGAAIVRAEGVPRPLPFFNTLVESLLPGEFEDITAAIDYVLEPGGPARRRVHHAPLRGSGRA